VTVLLIVLWGYLMIVGFALIQLGAGTQWAGIGSVGLGQMLYSSGETFFTLGFGDMTTNDPFGRFLCILEAGTGFGMLGIVVAYLPVYYSAFSRREIAMVLLDSKAGSDATATELLRRHATFGCMDDLKALLREYERWSAELLECYISFPMLAFYRSQHEDQFWLKTMTAILDTCALIEAGLEDGSPWARSLRFQARATFAMARHVVVDLAYVIDVPPDRLAPDRLPPESLTAMRDELTTAGLPMLSDFSRLAKIRETYEPYVAGLADHMIVDLPKWRLEKHEVDHWQTSAWDGVRHF
jgi:hypothetical protein